MITGIYHSPYFGCNLITNKLSIDDLTEWLAVLLVNDKNILILGDFDIHINKKGEDEDTSTFMNTIKALGFQQHVNFSTHRMGNTLDLLLTESSDPFKIKSILPGNYISDHCTVNCTISLEKTILKKQTIKFRKSNKIDITKFIVDINLTSALDKISSRHEPRLNHNKQP